MTASHEMRNRAAVYSEPGTTKTEVIELEVPTPGPGEVLVRLHFSGVCHTDAAFCLNQFTIVPPTTPGQIGGHEGAGEVVAHGAGVSAPAIGAHVGIKFAADACLTCEHCIEGGDSTCQNTQISGYTVPGTFQKYCLAPARYVTPIPSGLDLATAAPLMCGGVTVYTALTRAGLRPGDWVVVSGAGGGLGHLGVQYAKALGGRVVGVDAGAAKRKLCEELGADAFVDYAEHQSDEELAASIKKATGGGGARIALMCAASSKSYGQAMAWLAFRGTLACLGIPEKEGALVPSIGDMVTYEHRIIATKTGNRLEAKQCLELAAQGKIKARYTLRRLEDLTEIFEEMEAGKIQGRVVLDLRGD
ncbi:alcohol dehydrogenase [Plectosphaerella cucumerina]|uniref:Alcohol dehydrogenase n=1 Tax=Plectosphaerella cucumerina TaxID=40658 RepID=A0A8K0X6C0_9PEZI|nr:alcohol dehydrogenase [Plectosphaerella cucumerina]